MIPYHPALEINSRAEVNLKLKESTQVRIRNIKVACSAFPFKFPFSPLVHLSFSVSLKLNQHEMKHASSFIIILYQTNPDRSKVIHPSGYL